MFNIGQGMMSAIKTPYFNFLLKGGVVNHNLKRLLKEGKYHILTKCGIVYSAIIPPTEMGMYMFKYMEIKNSCPFLKICLWKKWKKLTYCLNNGRYQKKLSGYWQKI